MSALKSMIIVPALLVLTACGGNSVESVNTNSCAATTTGSITLDGQVTFQRVPHNGFGLDYTATFDAPARGVTVQAFNADSNSLVTTGSTDASGNYSLSVPNNTNIKIRVVAEMLKTGSLPNWNFSVKDNTNGNAVYVMDGSSACTGTSNETRNLSAPSGWTGTSYTTTRSAAPFAILDTVYDGVQLVLGANATLNFPALNLYWSPNNTDTSSGGAYQGGTYFDGNNGIYLLGDQNVDTDEYDPSVIAHEWGHYIEAHFSRSDSIGGFHSTGDYLDMRVAFGEGFGNAFSSMVRNDPVYADSNGSQQSTGFGFNVESETVSNPGWYSESSVEKILYDLYDSTNDSADADTLSLGFQPIWDVLINEERSEPVFTSIFKFITALKAHYSSDTVTTAAIDALINAQNIHVDDVYGSTETNDASNTDVLPIFDVVTTTTPATNVCVTNAFRRGAGTADYNVLGMNHYLRFTPTTTGSYQFTISSGSTSGDPDAAFYNDNGIDTSTSTVSGVETFVETLNTLREYMFEFNDYQILTNTSSTVSRCYTVSVVKQ
jgi:hypothetical protein